MRRYWAFSLTALLVGVLGANRSYSDTISSWNGGSCPTQGACAAWSVAGNWKPPVVPNNSEGTQYDVTIGSGAFTKLDISPTINSLTLDGLLYAQPSGPAPTLTVVHNATINGNLLFGGNFTMPTVGPGSLSVGGNLSVTGNSAAGTGFVSVNGSVIVGGNFTNTATPALELFSTSGSDVFRVGQTLTNGSRSVMLLGNDRCFGANCTSPPGYNSSPVGGPSTSAGSFVNRGQVFSWSSISASTLANYGTTTLVGNSANVRTLKNAGTIYLSNSCCSIAPEQTAGLNVGSGVSGDLGYNQSANGVLDELILGNSAYGKILAPPWLIPGGKIVGYPISLNGTLDIMLRNGFTPTIGEAFTILTFGPGDLSGTFSKVTWDSFDGGRGKFVVFYDNAAGDIVVTAETGPVPEPATLLLLASGLCLVFWVVRRHTAR